MRIGALITRVKAIAATSQISTHAYDAATAADETSALLGAVQETADAAGRVLTTSRDAIERCARLNASTDLFRKGVCAL